MRVDELNKTADSDFYNDISRILSGYQAKCTLHSHIDCFMSRKESGQLDLFLFKEMPLYNYAL